MFRIKRVYAPPASEDGLRILVDGLWPRGLSKQAAAVDAWVKDVAPSRELRQWFNHDAQRWREFTFRYRQELKSPARASALDLLLQKGREQGIVTLLFAARDETHNHAVVLHELLRKMP
ncbi:MAG: DUF488 family protein [Rhodospirillales bacterium]|nr:DUF488 family protein [Rhodospirillales bacterium]